MNGVMFWRPAPRRFREMIRRFAFVAAALLIAGCSGASVQSALAPQSSSPLGHAVVPDVGTNLVLNPGFESPINPGIVTCLTVNPSVGNWLPYAQTNGTLPITENSVLHAGRLSLEVHTPGAPQGCGGDAIYQDLNAPIPAAASYTFSYWALPSLGEQQQSILFGWGHGNGTLVATHDVFVDPTQTKFDAWGQTMIGPAVTYGTWHLFVFSVDAVTLTATLRV